MGQDDESVSVIERKRKKESKLNRNQSRRCHKHSMCSLLCIDPVSRFQSRYCW